jgi:hypothetical protein
LPNFEGITELEEKMAAEKNRRAFISYSRVNKEFATKLSKGLRAAGYPIWFDQLDIPTGARWDDELEDALQECSIFMIILTPASIASENVKDEIGYAIDHGKRILPVLLEDCDVPLRLRRFQYVDFTTKSFEEGFESAKDLLGDLVDEVSIPITAKPPVVKVAVEEKPAPVQSKPVAPVEVKLESVQPKPVAAIESKPAVVEKAPSNKKGILTGILIGVVSVIVLCIVLIAWSNSAATKMALQATSTSAVVASTPGKTPISTKESPASTQKPAFPYALDSADAQKLWDGGGVNYFWTLAKASYTADQISTFQTNNEPIPLVLSYSEPLSLHLSECVADQASLEKSMSFIDYIFKLDDKTIPEGKRIYVDYTDTDGLVCRSPIVIIDNWTSGAYLVSATWTVTTAYNDGVNDWTVGQTGTTSYQITVP